ncbi:putative membrane protein [Hartmannibacter diazotrophicus]|uniref:Protoporphyrinogen IX oxidase n=1 Tax=Hartmannibacter diazotrophicus TaxID=1482074 RepID=A0A2C9DCY5_9HYPH|nr:protoporphyrinogen oxidase HemJ [Hartmannibacter diazotrophicus]SON58184.1 putative membrane protein [Hartmannibacter diazotrophicus]
MYDWLKALHIISVIAWMAGTFYLPRLFVYHADAVAGSDKSETFKVMERRLLKAIMTPAMISTWVFGLWTAYEGGFFLSGWLHAKLLLVVILSGFHGLCAKWVKDFAKDQNRHTARFYRMINEVPTLLLVGIVLLVVLKPF